MNLILRFLLTLFGASRRSPLGVLDTSSLDMRVWPTDLDVQMHMNNGRYLSLMDLGRIDLMTRSGFWAQARRRGWFPVVGSLAIEYRHSLDSFERYSLTTRILGWDDRWFYLEQQFLLGGRIAAVGIVKAMIRSRAGAVTPAEAIGTVSGNLLSPPLPSDLAARVSARSREGTPA